jgi:hypothetical protein
MGIALLKLITGEDVIGDVVDVNEATVSILRPLKAVVSTDRGVPSINLVRYALLGDMDDFVEFNNEHVMSLTKPMQKAVDYYTKICDNMSVGSKSIEDAIDGTHAGYPDDNDLSVQEMIDLLTGKVTLQ